MINTSDAWKEYIRNHNVLHIRAELIYGDSSQELVLYDEDFMMGSVVFTDSISDEDSFRIGAVVSNTFEATLNNTDGKFDDFPWGNSILDVYFCMDYDDEVEWLFRGRYYVDKPTSMGDTIDIVAYDGIDKLNKSYTVDLHSLLPQTPNRFIQSICQYCNVGWSNTESWKLSNTYIVPEDFEYDETTTCRQVIQWICEVCGGYARINDQGFLVCRSCDGQVWNTPDYGVADGGTFSPWNAGANVNGYQMWYDGGETVDGGRFQTGAGIEFEDISRIQVGADDITFDGVIAYQYNPADVAVSEMYGEDGYVISIEDNPMCTEREYNAVPLRVWSRIYGLHLRRFEATVWGDPAYEAGDSCILEDYRGRLYPSVITNLRYHLGGLMEVSCGVESLTELEVKRASIVSQATKRALSLVNNQITDESTIDGWKVVKKQDGTIEATRSLIVGFTTSQAYGNMYRGYYTNILPSNTFTKIDSIEATVESTSGVVCNISAKSTERITMQFLSPVSLTNTTATVYIRVNGK